MPRPRRVRRGGACRATDPRWAGTSVDATHSIPGDRSTTPAFRRVSLNEGVPADRGHAAGYEAGYADGRRDAEAAARDAEREATARIDTAVSALGRSADAAARPTRNVARARERGARFAFDLLEALFGRESVLAVDPGPRRHRPRARPRRRDAAGRRPALSGRCGHHRGPGRSFADSVN